MTTWKKEVESEMGWHGESWTDVVSSTFKSGEENVEFDEGYGMENGVAFTVWTKKRVYFPAIYDGSEWCASVSREPNKLATLHVGGG